MMFDLMEYRFDGKQVRTVMRDGDPWFVANDVCKILGYANSRDALMKHVDDVDKGVAKRDTLGGAQDMTIINEYGLYDLTISSKLSAAKNFKRWITHEVLPAIRKQGYYSALPPEQLAQVVMEAVGDKWKLDHVIIPALRNGNVEQAALVAKYMGLTEEEYQKEKRLREKSMNNLVSKNVMAQWNQRGSGCFTIDDFPEPYRSAPGIRVTPSKLIKKEVYFGQFSEYCGQIYFDKNGYQSIVDYLVRNKLFKKRDEEICMNHLKFLLKEVES